MVSAEGLEPSTPRLKVKISRFSKPLMPTRFFLSAPKYTDFILYFALAP
jgi:hypothetical protein